MKFFKIEPEVAGGFGPNTLIERSTGKIEVKKLHYIFKGWLGDDVVEANSCYLVSERLSLDLNRQNFTGIEFDEVEVTFDQDLVELNPNLHIPRFIWLRIVGEAKKDDFGLNNNLILVISERVYNALKRFNIHYADIEEFNG